MTAPIALSRIHHVAYRCKDAKVTADWYAYVLGMEFTTAFAEDHVPSTGEYDPYMHIFLDCGGGNVIAFFELPNQPDMGKDPNTPAFTSGILLFRNSYSIKQLFQTILDHAALHIIEEKPMPRLLDQPFIVYNAVVQRKYDNQILKLYAENNQQIEDFHSF